MLLILRGLEKWKNGEPRDHGLQGANSFFGDSEGLILPPFPEPEWAGQPACENDFLPHPGKLERRVAEVMYRRKRESP